jgi:HlyD family secretion protein
MTSPNSVSQAGRASSLTDTYPDKTYDGEIAQISPEANRQKATVQVKVQVLNPGKYPDVFLRPEMNATVKFSRTKPKASSAQPKQREHFVPAAAVRDHDGKKVVFLAFDGKARMP